MQRFMSRIKFAVGADCISFPKWLFQVSIGFTIGILVCVLLDMANLGWSIGIVLPMMCVLVRRC